MENNKTFIIIAIVVLAIVVTLAFVIKPKEKEKNMMEDLLNINYEVESNETELAYNTENPVVAMYVEGYGSIVMELYPSVAPNTVNNFISLVKSGFYDNNTFHRLVPGFVLQGGDPDGKGTGGPNYSIKGEFTQNGFKNDLSHTKGVISMARSNDMDSAGSQFFICIDDATSLDGLYATFGKVIDGWDNIKRIIKQERVADPQSGKLADNLTIKKALVDLKGKEYQEVEKVSE